MFLRVSSPVCASDVDGNPYHHRSLARPRILVAQGGPDGSAGLNIDADFVVAVGRARLSGQEQHAGAPGGEPASEELGGARGAERLAEQRLEPAADVA